MTDAAARRRDTLRPRILSALVLIPAALAAVWFGSPWIAILVGLAGVAMGWEWGRLAAVAPKSLGIVIAVAAVALTVAAAAAHRFPLALAIAVGGALAAALSQRRERRWLAGGTLWIAGGCLAFLWLATPAQGGRDTLICLLAVVWATDIFAYLAGRTIGGRRLAPQLSPNKTWSGLFGGVLGAAAAGALAAATLGLPVAATAAIGLFLGLIAQAGDLAESGAKRHFAVKDTSGLIPGHGGALDRLDGLLAAAIAAALLTLAVGGRALHI